MNNKVLLWFVACVAVGIGLAGAVWIILSIASTAESSHSEITDNTDFDFSAPAFHAAETINLWRYLQDFAVGQSMPETVKITTKFGQPQDSLGWEIVVSNASQISDSFYRFNELDGKYLPVTGSRYYNGDDQQRWIDVVIRNRDDTVVGWSWSENVPPGEEIGPPPP